MNQPKKIEVNISADPNLLARAMKAETENALLHAAMRDEIDEGLRLRELGGALPDENITAMTERVIAERDDFPRGAESADGWTAMHLAGKKAAGRLLDGRTHDEFPEAA